MSRALPLVLLVLVLGGAAFFLLQGGDPAPLHDYDDGEDADLTDEERERVLLEGDPQAAARLEAERKARERAAAEAEARRKALASAQPKVFLAGRVVDDATDQPIAGAYTWLENAQQPCPRLPGRGALVQRADASYRFLSPLGDVTNASLDKGVPPPRSPRSTERTDADGRFSMAARGDIDHAKLEGGFDLFVMADGYIAACECAVPNGREIQVRLKKGHRIRGTVRNVFSRPVADLAVRAVPTGDTPKQLGHYASTTTDEQGRFELTGLQPGAVMVQTALTQSYMPKEVGPIDPQAAQPLDIELVSALQVSFSIQTADGQPPRNPSLEWQTSGKPPHRGLQMLLSDRADPWKPESKDRLGGYPTLPVPIPCDHREVTFTVKADGHSAWRSRPVLLPQEGGKNVVPVALQADTSVGSIRVSFENESGEPQAYNQLNADERIIVRGEQKVEGGVVKLVGEDFRLNDLPPGPYALAFRMPKHAPARVEFDVVAGEETAVTVTLRDPARLRVRFVAPERMVVKFSISKDRRPVAVFVEGDDKPADDPTKMDPDAPAIESSDEGTVLTGLGGGEHLIEVTDPKVRTVRKRVTLIEGDEVEVEIRLAYR